MPIYTPGRRRTMLILLLSSVMLLTIDLRGNAILDAARSGFDYAFRPFEVAAEVVSGPVVRAWDGITRVDDLEAENAILRRQIDAQRSDQIAGQNALQQNRALRALLGLKSLAEYPRVSCAAIGGSPSNLDQTVEIDCGTLDGIKVGMPVLNDAGLVGKVTQASPETAHVMLLTDPRYVLTVKVVGDDVPEEDETEPTTPSGLPEDEIGDIADEINNTTSTTTTTTTPWEPGMPSPNLTTTTLPETPAGAEPGDATGGGVGLFPGAGTSTTQPSTTTTTIPKVTRETGRLSGFGPDLLPRVDLVADSPRFTRPRVGDAVLTTGGSASLSPQDIPIGRVVNIIARPGTEGLLLEIEPNADLSRLDFLTVILYQPPTEMPR